MGEIFFRQDMLEDAMTSFLEWIRLAELEVLRDNPYMSGSWDFMDVKRKLTQKEKEAEIRYYKFMLVQVMTKLSLTGKTELWNEVIDLLESIYRLSTIIDAHI